jgi:hypothetical protein
MIHSRSVSLKRAASHRKRRMGPVMFSAVIKTRSSFRSKTSDCGHLIQVLVAYDDEEHTRCTFAGTK